VSEGYGVKVADAARPESLRDHLFADIEILRSLMRATAQAAAIDEQGLAVRRDQEKRIALAYIDGFHQQSVMRMLDGARGNCNESSEQQCGPRCPTSPAYAASQRNGCGEEQTENS
jgi:hypothetical protein